MSAPMHWAGLSSMKSRLGLERFGMSPWMPGFIGIASIVEKIKTHYQVLVWLLIQVAYLPELVAAAALAAGATCCASFSTSLVMSLSPFRLIYSDWIVQIGPHGIPHHPRSTEIRMYVMPFIAAFSPARIRWICEVRRKLTATSEMQ